MMESTKYAFRWDLLGNLDVGRPNLGRTTRVEVYRLMQYTLRAALEEEFGTPAADRIFFNAGLMSGRAFFDHYLQKELAFDTFTAQLTSILRELGVGVLRIEKADIYSGQFTFTVSEDLDCSGLPELNFEICVYDEGFFSGIFEKYWGEAFQVKEIDCWCTGGRTCRFSANRTSDGNAC